MMMSNKVVRVAKGMLLAEIVACGIMIATAFGQSAHGSGTTATPSTAPPASKSSPYHPEVPGRARDSYLVIWGVDSLNVRSVESGELIRFDYRVVDAVKAQPLNDKKSEPVLIDERARVKLVVPSLEKVGQLRQSSPPEVGKVYWMAFSNKGGLVKRGDRVSVVIGTFRADGLVVQ